MIRRPPRSTPLYSSAASDVYKRQLIYYLILLAVFSLIGWILGTVDITLKENGSHFLIKMGAATAIALFTSVAVSFYVFNAMQIIFFFEV